MRLTLSDIDSVRANAKPLPKAIAASTSSNSFKSQHSKDQPRCKSLAHHLSIESRHFSGSALKKSATQTHKSHVIPLGVGRPIAEFYPWEAVTFEECGLDQFFHSAAPENGTIEPSPNKIIRRGGAYDLAMGLNYCHATGSPPLIRLMTEHVELIHNPPYSNWATCLSAGSTSALEVSLRMFCNRGDSVLTEKYTYPGMIDVAPLLDLRLVGVDLDAEGLMPGRLANILRTWDLSQGPKPRVLYTIPSGQNPTGATISLERKQAVYAIAEEHDLIIIEDDPYYFLQTNHQPPRDNYFDPSPFIAALPPSFLSIDTSGRVIRLDSFSKLLAPGLRAGWVTAPAEIIERFNSYYEVTTVGVGGPTQLMLYSLLEVNWGHAGFLEWLQGLAGEYGIRLDVVVMAAEKCLPKEVCSWVRPGCGMFLWVAVDLGKHPRFCVNTVERKAVADQGSDTAVNDIENRIWNRAMEYGVQVTKGSLFRSGGAVESELHFRLTYAAAEEDELVEGVMKLAAAVMEEFGLAAIE